MEQELVVRPCVTVWVLAVHRHEHERVAVYRHLERLQFSVSQVVWTQRNEAVDKRVRIPSVIHHCGAADILDNPDVAAVIRMDAFVTTSSEAAIEGAQTSTRSGVRIKIGAHFDDTAVSASFLGKKQRPTKWIPC